MNNYAPLPVHFVKGQGAELWDSTGKRYLDAHCGVAVTTLGHCHPKVTQALVDQAQQLWHVSNWFHIDSQEALGDTLCSVANMERVFFCNSGAEANEAAIKLTRLYAREQGIAEPLVITTEGSFHGRTMATLTATGNDKVRHGFEPLLPGFQRVPYNDIAAIEAIDDVNVVAVMVEPIQGEGGVNIPDADYCERLRGLCDERGWLLIADEIQTGIARTGQWFAHQHGNSRPDIMTLAKGLGNGMPIGACLAHGQAATLFAPGTHGSTFGGNPLATTTALAVLHSIEKEQLNQRASALGQRLLQGLQHSLADHPLVADIRGFGLMIGIELTQNCAELMQRGLDAGLVINVTAGNTIRLLPPAVMSDDQADELIVGVTALIHAL